MKKIGLLILFISLVSCGKDEVTTGQGKTVDEFTRGYQDQIGRNGIAKQGETVNLFQEMQITINNLCTYDFAYGERVVINNNPKLIKIYSKDVWNRVKGPISQCGPSRIDETVYQVPAVKLQEIFLKSVTKKCDYLKDILDDRSLVTFCSQNFLGSTTFRSEQAGVFKTTLTLNLRGTIYNVTNDATHLSNEFLWVPYAVADRTLVNGREQTNAFTKTVIDYYKQTIDERDYDHLFVMDYYEGWEL